MKDRDTMKVDELRDLLERKKPVLVLDVRLLSEREEWAIPGSLFVDAYEKLKEGKENLFSHINFEKSVPVVTVCAAGKTSMIAMKQLKKMGLEAYSLEGGMRHWTKAWNKAEVVDSSSTRIVQFRRTGKGCLSYIIENNGEAIIIDASLDPATYIDYIDRNNWKLKAVLDTHTHADHFSRSKEISKIKKAKLLLPRQSEVGYKFNPIDERDTLSVGKATLKVIHTPGHTLDSYSYLLNNQSLFTGDTLFVDGIGRPDLKASPEMIRNKTSLLYASLQKILDLPIATIIYPSHVNVPVAFDEKMISNTLKEIKESVEMLTLNQQDFITTLMRKIPETPPNYQKIVELNVKGTFDQNDLIDLEAGANRCAIT